MFKFLTYWYMYNLFPEDFYLYYLKDDPPNGPSQWDKWGIRHISKLLRCDLPKVTEYYNQESVSYFCLYIHCIFLPDQLQMHNYTIFFFIFKKTKESKRNINRAMAFLVWCLKTLGASRSSIYVHLYSEITSYHQVDKSKITGRSAFS